jgi:hypothetical protein
MSRSSLRSFAAAGALAAVLAGGAVACDPAKDSSASPGGTPSKTAVSAPPKKADKESKATSRPAAKPAFKGDGTYQVGADIRPGTYLTSGNSDGMCYWERDKDAKGDTDSVLANDNVKGSSYVTVAKSDRIFKTTGCKDWYAATPGKPAKPAGTATARTTMSGNGMYKVGTDILPGTYRSAGSADGSCYWERSKDALHGIDSVIANDNVTGPAVVTIARTDAYFKSSDCADWRRTG